MSALCVKILLALHKEALVIKARVTHMSSLYGVHVKPTRNGSLIGNEGTKDPVPSTEIRSTYWNF